MISFLESCDRVDMDSYLTSGSIAVDSGKDVVDGTEGDVGDEGDHDKYQEGDPHHVTGPQLDGHSVQRELTQENRPTRWKHHNIIPTPSRHKFQEQICF